MNLHPDDSRLTAYLMGELPADEAAAVQHAVAADPALQVALAKLATIQRVLTDTLAPDAHTLLPHQHQAIREAARHATTAANLAAHIRHKPWQPWLMPLAAAAAIILAILLFAPPASRRTHGSGKDAAVASSSPPAAPERRAHLLGTPQPAAAATPADLTAGPAVPALNGNCSVATADFPTLQLPLQAGHCSLDRIRACIHTERQLPPRRAVRLEEILNSFAFRPNGLSAIARHPATYWHPDDRDSGATAHAATLATETLACPWKPSASLVLISICGNPFSDCQIQAVFRPNPATVHRYRLLGFGPVDGQAHAPLATCLPTKSSISLALEIEPAAAAGDFGIIEWSVNELPAAALALVRHDDAEPSDDARFAALVCTFCQWLAGDHSSMIDRELIAALAREITAANLPAEHTDFLKLINQALNL
jgi:hypothetical protein